MKPPVRPQSRVPHRKAPFLVSSLSTLLAATSSKSSGGSSGFLLIMIVVIIGIFFFMSRSQRRQRQRVADLQSRLTPGQEVMTGAGIYGRIVSATDDRVNLEIAPGTVIAVARQAITRTVDPVTEPPVAPPASDEPTAGATAAPTPGSPEATVVD